LPNTYRGEFPPAIDEMSVIVQAVGGKIARLNKPLGGLPHRGFGVESALIKEQLPANFRCLAVISAYSPYC
jgi:hypothetical protein